MADKRKLQGDIERCLKKVAEGVESFEDIWKKIQSTANANQKEKYEADLKKEIKKLQRLRDQIKTWLTSNDIKDKSVLQENRKLIETQMERFKVVERETKIKAYSKEGLGAVQKVDPAQKEKDKITNWLTDSIGLLTIQVDHYESEIETLSAVTKKKKNYKEKLSRIEELKTWLDKHRYHIDQLEALLRMLDNGTVEANQIKKIQDDIKHYIDSSQEPDFQENEYIYDELGLEDFEGFLAKQRAVNNSECDGKTTTEEESNAARPTSSNASTSTSSSSPVLSAGTSIQTKEPENKVLKKPVAVKPNVSNSSGATPCSVSNKPASSTSSSSSRSNSSSTQASLSSILPEVPNTFLDSSVFESPFTPSPRKSPTNVLQISRIPENCWFVGSEKSEKSNHSSISSENNIGSLTSSTCNNPSTHLNQVQNCSSVTNQNALVPDSTPHQPLQPEKIQCLPVETQTDNSRSEQIHNITEPQSSPEDVETNSISSSSIDRDFPELPSSTMPLNSEPRSTKPSDGSVPLLNFFPSPGMSNGRLESRHQTSQPTIPVDKGEASSSKETNSCGKLINQTPPLAAILGKAPSPPIMMPPSTRRSGDLFIPPIIGIYPVGSVSVVHESRAQLRILEAASHHLPYVADSCKLRGTLNRGPADVPHYYKSSLPHCDSFEFFQHLSTETLFFIFYYMELTDPMIPAFTFHVVKNHSSSIPLISSVVPLSEDISEKGSKAQYLAAKTLKKQSWRFHTRLMLWFQRHEEPKTITDEYEQGTYIYFDYEKWSQRKKDGFTFEYRYLEDIDLN